MTDYDSWPAFRHLAQEVADALGVRRGERWEVTTWHEDHAHPAATLTTPDIPGARLSVQYGFAAVGKVTITGKLPEGTSGRVYARNADPGRGARAIATAADTHVLRGGYLDMLPEKLEQQARMARREAGRAAIMARFAALFQLDPTGDGKLSLSPLLPMRGEVSLDHNTTDDGQDAPRVSLELHGLDVATAEAMLTAMAASPGIQARCCAVFGPGHDPRLARLGCRRAAARDAKPTWEEGDALYSLYRQSGTAQPWEDWLGDTDVHAAWR